MSRIVRKISKGKILVIDDAFENRLLLSSQLGLEGYEILQAKGGIEGIEAAQTHIPDVILLDVMMPDMNGFEVCKALKQNPETNLIPIIIITALREVQYRIEGIEAGADEFLSKPYIREELLARLSMLIRFKNARFQLKEERDKLFILEKIVSGRKEGLTKLDLSRKGLNDLPLEIGRWTKLRKLDLNSNNLKDLPPEIGHLTQLNELDLSSNCLATLPSTLNRLRNLNFLDLRDNPLPIPNEIMALTDQPKTIIDFYFQQEISSLSGSYNEAKVILLGQGGSGKTSLVNRLVYDTCNENEAKTIGIDIQHWQISLDEAEVRLNIWDYGGQEINHAAHQFFLTKRSLYLLVLDARQGEQGNRIEYWLKLIENFGGNSPIIVVVNKIDQHQLELNQRDLQVKHPAICAFVNTSCITGDGITLLREKITHTIFDLPHVHELFPVSWLSVKNRLEEIGGDLLSYDSYLQICEEEYVKDESDQRKLIRFLHDLGVVVNFQEDRRLLDTNVLNPEWAVKGIYQILNSEELAQNRGVLKLEHLSKVLNKRIYPRHRLQFLMDLMRKFELCFPFVEMPSQFLIPDLLPKAEPEFEWDASNNLVFEYHYDILPSNILSRFIVRMHNYIFQEKYWRNGVILAYEENQALIKADSIDSKIFIWIKGKLHTRRNFLSVIRYHFTEIHNSLLKIEAKEAVPLPDYPTQTISYRELCVLEDNNYNDYFYAQIGAKISVNQLLNGVEAPYERDLPNLFEKLARCFNEEGLRDICFQLNIEFENLGGTGKDGKARELILFSQKHGRITDLVTICRKLRPSETW